MAHSSEFGRLHTDLKIQLHAFPVPLKSVARPQGWSSHSDGGSKWLSGMIRNDHELLVLAVSSAHSTSSLHGGLLSAVQALLRVYHDAISLCCRQVLCSYDSYGPSILVQKVLHLCSSTTHLVGC